MLGAHSLLRHVVGPDGASLTFATENEVTRLWIVAAVLDLQRDWSWDGLDYLRVERDGREVGRVLATTSAGHEAHGNDERDRSTLMFLDAVDPKPAPGAFPRPLNLEYRLTPVFRTAPENQDDPLEQSIQLPVVTPPQQAPRLVSAGLALSPYRRDQAYSVTEERLKAVWLEFDRPPDDPEDRYYARVLASAPDPVLTDVTEGVPDIPDVPLPIDPEPLRRIVPGQGDDRAGQASMQMLLPTTSPVHFLLATAARADARRTGAVWLLRLRVQSGALRHVDDGAGVSGPCVACWRDPARAATAGMRGHTQQDTADDQRHVCGSGSRRPIGARHACGHGALGPALRARAPGRRHGSAQHPHRDTQARTSATAGAVTARSRVLSLSTPTRPARSTRHGPTGHTPRSRRLWSY